MENGDAIGKTPKLLNLQTKSLITTSNFNQFINLQSNEKAVLATEKTFEQSLYSVQLVNAKFDFKIF